MVICPIATLQTHVNTRHVYVINERCDKSTARVKYCALEFIKVSRKMLGSVGLC